MTEIFSRIIAKCNRINPEIGGFRMIGGKDIYTFANVIHTTGDYILHISDEAYQDELSNSLTEDRIQKIVSKAKKKIK